jgi:hypothetical protein
VGYISNKGLFITGSCYSHLPDFFIWREIMSEQSNEQPAVQSPNQTASAPTSKSVPTENSNINNLGYYLDGWADLIPGMGDKLEQVKSTFWEQLSTRTTSNMAVTKVIGIDGILSTRKRNYVISTTSPGVTTAIYIRKNAQDLFVSWRSFIRPVLNPAVLALVLISIIVVSFFTLISTSNGLGNISIMGYRVFETRTIYFTALLFAAGAAVFTLLIEIALIALAGRLLKGDLLAFFFVEPTVFDADDVTAMNFAIHLSLLRALDQAGIDLSKLRLKPSFKGGRRGEDV